MPNDQAHDTRTTVAEDRVAAAVSLSVAGVVGNASVSGPWVIQAHDYLSPLPIQTIYPRPDAETSANALHRKAHTGLTYRIPIGVRAGCWPYKYEIITGPSGATIGSEMTRTTDSATDMILHEPGAEYGFITWDAPTDGETFSFLVRVTDQLGVSVDIAWSGAVDNASYVFIDSTSGDDTNAGTQAAPLGTFANGLWKNDDSDNTYGGKIAVFTGTADINAGTIPSSPALSSTTKPAAFIAGPSGAIFNCSNGHFRTSGSLNDFVIGGITIDGSRTDLSNNRIFNLTNRTQRFTAFECTVDNITSGTSENDNPGIFCLMGVGSNKHEYNFITSNTMGESCTVQLATSFDSEKLLWERNKGSDINVTALNGGHFFEVKDDSSYVTVRGNVITGTAIGNAIRIYNQNTLTPRISDQESCYNRVVYVRAEVGGIAMYWNGWGGRSANSTHDYRNSVVSAGRAFRELSGNEGDESVNFMASVYYAAGSEVTLLASNPDAPASVELSSQAFNSVAKLIGSARTTHLGELGAEIAGAS
jgi:hypothetical protein